MGLNLQNTRAKKGYDIYSRWARDSEGLSKVIAMAGADAQKQKTNDTAKGKMTQPK